MYTSVADTASSVNNVATSGALARSAGGESDLPKIPLTGGYKKIGGTTTKPHSGGKSKKRRSKRNSNKNNRRSRRRKTYKK